MSCCYCGASWENISQGTISFQLAWPQQWQKVDIAVRTGASNCCSKGQESVSVFSQIAWR